MPPKFASVARKAAKALAPSLGPSVVLEIEKAVAAHELRSVKKHFDLSVRDITSIAAFIISCAQLGVSLHQGAKKDIEERLDRACTKPDALEGEHKAIIYAVIVNHINADDRREGA